MKARTGGAARLLAVHDRVTDVEFVLAAFALALLLMSFLFEVAARYFFGSPTTWSSDVVQYAMCFSGALALPTVTRDAGHVAITSFLEKLPSRRQASATRAIVWLGAVSLAATSAVFALVALEQARQGLETVAAFAIPKWWLTAVVGLGFLDSSLHLLRQATGWNPASAGREIEL